jgi:molybdopterin/thiamine biosynthesis adenylyltransferase
MGKGKDWRIILFVACKNRLSDLQGELRGRVREEEHLIHLFPKDFAPGGLPIIAEITPKGDKVIGRDGILLTRSPDGFLAHGSLIGSRVPVTVYDWSQIYDRTPFNPSQLNRLQRSQVAFIGLGSVGGTLAIALARAGIGDMIMADPDLLELANVSRHEGNLLDVGRAKVEVIKERIGYINPATRVETHQCNIFDWPDSQLKRLFEKTSLLAVTTDRPAIQLLANDWAWRLNIPAVFAGCYEEARGGEIFCTLPQSSAPCYACLRGGLARPERKGSIDYSRAAGPEDYQGEPGLHSAVSLVTNVAAQAALSILLRGEPDCELAALITPEQNFILVGGARAKGFYRFRKSFDIFFQPLKGPRHDCPTCGGAARSPLNLGHTGSQEPEK